MEQSTPQETNPVASGLSGTIRNFGGFTLLELLVVMGIVGILLAVTAPVWRTLNGSSNIAKSSSDIGDILEQARSYAMGNNTHTYVGIWEVDLLQAQAGASNLAQGIGRVAIGTVYSPTGLSLFSPGSSLSQGNITTNNAAQLGKLNYFENLHLTDLHTNNSGGLARPDSSILITSYTPTTMGFQWPLSGTAVYPNSFVKVIEFTPQGCARVQTTATNDPSLVNYIEIGLVPSHGNVFVTSDTKNSAVLQINGTSGSIHLYRP